MKTADGTDAPVDTAAVWNREFIGVHPFQVYNIPEMNG